MREKTASPSLPSPSHLARAIVLLVSCGDCDVGVEMLTSAQTKKQVSLGFPFTACDKDVMSHDKDVMSCDKCVMSLVSYQLLTCFQLKALLVMCVSCRVSDVS